MIPSLAIAVLVTAWYCFIYILSADSNSINLIELSEFLAPIVGSALTLVGVAITIRHEAKKSEKAIVRSEANANRILRLERMPAVLCTMDSIQYSSDSSGASLEGATIRLRLIGDNPAHDVSLAVVTGELLDSSYILIHREILTREDNTLEKVVSTCELQSIISSSGERANTNDSQTPSGLSSFPINGILSFKDVLNNSYWRFFSGAINFIGSNRSTLNLSINFSENTNYSEEKSPEKFRRELELKMKKERESSESAKLMEKKEALWRSAISQYDYLEKRAWNLAWTESKLVDSYLQDYYRDRLVDGGYGGRHLVSMSTFRCWKEFTYQFSTCFGREGDIFPEKEITWSNSVLVNSKNGRVTHVGRSILVVEPMEKTFDLLKLRVCLAIRRPRLINPIKWAISLLCRKMSF